MAHVVTQAPARFSACEGRAWVRAVPVLKDNLVWLFACVETGQCAIIDGPAVLEPVLQAIAEEGWTLTTVFNTHTHWDHIGINQALEKAGQLSALRVVGYGGTAADIPGLTVPVNEGDAVSLGNLSGVVMLTEGHLNGHISLRFGDVLFCGDTLFAGGCGYLFDGPPAVMFQSLLRLADLAGDTKVCCAHEYTQDNLRFAWMIEPSNTALQARIESVWNVRAAGGCTVPSTIAEEQATNPFLRPGSSEIRASIERLAADLTAATHVDVFAAIRELKNRGLHKSMELWVEQVAPS